MIDTNTYDLDQPAPSLTKNTAAQLNETQARILDIWLTTGQRSAVQLHTQYEEKYGELPITKFNVEFSRLKKIIVTFNRRELREHILVEYELLYSEAMQAWLDSKKDEVEYVETRSESEKGYKETATERRKAQTGDPRHWGNASRALEAIRNIAGVDEPKRVEAIIKREMDTIFTYLEANMSPQAFEEFVSVMVQYEDDTTPQR